VPVSTTLTAVNVHTKCSNNEQTQLLSSHLRASPVLKNGRVVEDVAPSDLAVSPVQSLMFSTSETSKNRAGLVGAGWLGAFGVVAIHSVSNTGINRSLGLHTTYPASDEND